MPVSSDVHILSERELDRIKNEAFQRGVTRGRFEERCFHKQEPVALNCNNWNNGNCETCGAQTQYFQVSWDYKCPHFTERKSS